MESLHTIQTADTHLHSSPQAPEDTVASVELWQNNFSNLVEQALKKHQRLNGAPA